MLGFIISLCILSMVACIRNLVRRLYGSSRSCTRFTSCPRSSMSTQASVTSPYNSFAISRSSAISHITVIATLTSCFARTCNLSIQIPIGWIYSVIAIASPLSTGTYPPPSLIPTSSMTRTMEYSSSTSTSTQYILTSK